MNHDGINFIIRLILIWKENFFVELPLLHCVVAVEGFKVTLNECFVYVTLSIVIGDLNPTGFDRNINWENPLLDNAVKS